MQALKRGFSAAFGVDTRSLSLYRCTIHAEDPVRVILRSPYAIQLNVQHTNDAVVTR